MRMKIDEKKREIDVIALEWDVWEDNWWITSGVTHYRID